MNVREGIKKLWNSVKKWANANSKAIGGAVGSLASFVVLTLTNKDLDEGAKAVIILVATAAVTWLFPANVKAPENPDGTAS